MEHVSRDGQGGWPLSPSSPSINVPPCSFRNIKILHEEIKACLRSHCLSDVCSVVILQHVLNLPPKYMVLWFLYIYMYIACFSEHNIFNQYFSCKSNLTLCIHTYIHMLNMCIYMELCCVILVIFPHFSSSIHSFIFAIDLMTDNLSLCEMCTFTNF